MPNEEMKKYLEILELGPTATLRDVKDAYTRLKKLYSEDSLALEPLADEFPEKKRKKILREIEDAYAKLLRSYSAQSSQLEPAKHPAAGTGEVLGTKSFVIETFSGPALREVRERLGIKLEDISNRLKLRQELIKNIEDERFGSLPEPVYLKAHLKNLAAVLELNPERVAEDYLKRYQARRS